MSAAETAKAESVRKLADYTEDPFSGFEHRRVRRTMDVVDEIESDRTFYTSLRTRARAWLIAIGLAGATWTAVLTLKGPVREIIHWLGMASP
jgi:hypothetical protein